MPFAKILQVVADIVQVVFVIVEKICESKDSKKEEKKS